MPFAHHLTCLVAAMVALAPLASHGAPALDWRPTPGGRVVQLNVSPGGQAGFTLVNPEASGIRFTNSAPAYRAVTNQIVLNGSGVAAGDVDGDGWCDLYFCRIDGPNALYRNLGDWKFREITAEAGVACANLNSTGAVLADIDGDSDLDLLVNTIGKGTHTFINNGKGAFTDMTPHSGLASKYGSMSFALADVEGDGDLDVYVVNYRAATFRDDKVPEFEIGRVNGRHEIVRVNGRSTEHPDLKGRFTMKTAGGVFEQGEPDTLFLNDGNGQFTAVNWTNGTFVNVSGAPIETPYDWGLAALFRDLNGDSLPDLYVCNDFESPDRIWMNTGGGKFRALADLTLRQMSHFSMGADVADINRDGWDDIFVVDMLSREHGRRHTQLRQQHAAPPSSGIGAERVATARNTLLLGQPNGAYAEVARLAGVDASEWSWAPAFLDVDLDGFEDILITNGHERDAQNIDNSEQQFGGGNLSRNPSYAEKLAFWDRYPRLATRNLAFRNRKDLTFEEVSDRWGFNFEGVSHGIAFADLDNDGDLDVCVNNLNSSVSVYRNNTSAPRIAVQLRAPNGNTRGIGARIRLTGAEVVQSQEMLSGGRYLSSDDAMRVFAAASENPMQLEVQWPDGKRTAISGVKSNRLYEIHHPGTTAPAADRGATSSASAPALFTDISDRLGWNHLQGAFDDFDRQPLLPRKLSQAGPGVTWFDINRDGMDDLIIGAGRSGRMGIFRNLGRGEFEPLSGAGFGGLFTRDQTTVLGLSTTNSSTALLFGLSRYDDFHTNKVSVRMQSIGGGSQSLLPDSAASVGPLALGDFDADGDLDLFVGGRVIPGQYPKPAPSFLLRNERGQFAPDTTAAGLFTNAGLVSSAIWSDLNEDGFAELILACEWGAIRIFINDRGNLQSADLPIRYANDAAQRASRKPQAATLGQLSGLWNSIAAGDFDGDGRMDLVAGNWGRNSEYQRHIEYSLRLYYDDLDSDGLQDLIESYYEPSLAAWVPRRDRNVLSRVIPDLRERFATCAAFAKAPLTDIIGPRHRGMPFVSAATLDTMLFLNRGEHLEARPLPIEAQFAPVFGVAVADFNGDGHEDVFLNQNFFAVEPTSSRQDAGRGLCLLGDGRGEFRVLSSTEAGIEIFGQGRGAAVADFDGDGRVDLAAAQNGAEVKLLQNTGATPGLRIRLQGSSSNPNGIGAVLRLVYPNGAFGPAREIHAGSGYWSQNSAVQVLGNGKTPDRIQVRWPGGKIEQAIARECAGELKVIHAAASD